MTDRNLQQSDLIWKQVVVVAAVGRLWMRVGVVVVGEGMYEARRGNQSCRLLHLPPIGFSTLAHGVKRRDGVLTSQRCEWGSRRVNVSSSWMIAWLCAAWTWATRAAACAAAFCPNTIKSKTSLAIVSRAARAREWREWRDVPSAASLAVGNSVVMPDRDPSPPILHTFRAAVPVPVPGPDLAPDRGAAVLVVGMLGLIPGRVGAGWWRRVLAAEEDGVGTEGLAHGDECADDGGGSGDTDGFEIGIVCSFVESCLDVEAMGTGEAWRPAHMDYEQKVVHKWLTILLFLWAGCRCRGGSL